MGCRLRERGRSDRGGAGTQGARHMWVRIAHIVDAGTAITGEQVQDTQVALREREPVHLGRVVQSPRI